jgi:hypothetical protein
MASGEGEGFVIDQSAHGEGWFFSFQFSVFSFQ